MAIDVETLAAARTYTDDSLKGVGSVQGKNCTIQEITKEGTTNTVVFGWTDDEGNVSTSEMIVEDGKDGADGVDGKDGETGPKGDPGEKGETGETGATGASAYEVALANGFEGSEEDWLTSLTPTNIVTVSNSPFESHASNFKINEIGGKAEQFSTTGSQLFDMSNAVGGTVAGITAVINPNGTYTLSGIAEEEYPNIWLAGYYSNTSSVFKLASGTYTLIDAIFYSNDGTTVKTFRNTFTIESEMPITAVRITALTVGQTYNNITFYPMLNAGATALPWEPYTGGMPAPNPDYPQEIKKTVVSEIKTHGKNLLNIDKTSTGYVTDDGTINNSALNVMSDYISLGEEGLILSVNQTLTSIGVAYYDENKTYLSRKDNFNKSEVVISKTNGVSCVRVWFNIDNTPIGDRLLSLEPMLNAGIIALPYEPYTESTIKLSKPVELYGIGDVQDTIDVENGKIIRHYGIATENNLFLASGGSVSAGGLRWFDCNTNSLEAGNGCCTHLIKPVYAWASTIPCYAVSRGYVRIYDTANTNEEFKAKYAGLEFIYQRATPTEEDLPLADQSALNSLKTFDNLTYVEFDSEVEPTFSGETALTTEGSHILEGLAKSNVLTLEYLDAATYICDNLP